MRISTSSIFESGTSQLGTLQSQLSKSQLHLSTMRRMLTAADDPIASARALEVTQSRSMNTQFETNRQNALQSLGQVDLALKSATLLLQDVKTLAVAAGNGSLSQVDRETHATELAGRIEDLLGLANSADGAGGYLFSGYKSSTQPFTQTSTGADYHGDQGQRSLQVGSARQLAVTESGSAVFTDILTGNGKFQTQAGAANGGSGIISPGDVTDLALFTRDEYAITFAVSATTPPVTTYTVMNTTTGLPVPPAPDPADPIPYETGKQIAFDGVAFDIKGSPVDGDTFTVAPSEKQSVFTTLTDMLKVLRAPGTGAVGQAALSNGLNTAQDNIDAALDNILSVQSSVGTRLRELDYLDSAGEDLDLQYASTLGDLQDLDMIKAFSLYTQQQLSLEAAQKSFTSMSKLSLFNFI